MSPVRLLTEKSNEKSLCIGHFLDISLSIPGLSGDDYLTEFKFVPPIDS